MNSLAITTANTKYSLSSADNATIMELGELGSIFEWQTELEETLGIFNMPPQVAVQEIISCAAVECGEALSHFLNKTKPWKNDKPIDFKEVDEEMIDVLHFVVAYFVVRAYDSSEVVEQYREKNLKVFQRVSEKMKSLSSGVTK